MTPDEVDSLLAALREAKLRVGVTEALRLRHLLATGAIESGVDLTDLVVCVVAKTAEERAECARIMGLWRGDGAQRLEEVLAAPAPSPPEREVTAEARTIEVRAPGVIEAPSQQKDPEDKPRVDPLGRTWKELPKPPPRSASLLWIGVVAVVGLVTFLLQAVIVSGSALPGQASLWARQSFVVLALAAIVWVVLISRRHKLGEPSMVATREAALDLPPPPALLTAPALLDGRAQDDLIHGVGSYVTEHPTRALDVRHTVNASSKAGGFPKLRFRFAREAKSVWLWVDASARDAILDRAVLEIHKTLRSSGLSAHVAIYRDLPLLAGLRRLDVTPEGVFAKGPYPALSADEIDAQRAHGVVAVLTDGRALAIAAEGARAKRVRRALAALKRFGSLAFVDFGEGEHHLSSLVGEHGLRAIAPNELAAFLAGDTVVCEGKGDKPLERAAITGQAACWAAACALSPVPVDEATAHALRVRLGLHVTPWSLNAMMRQHAALGGLWFGPQERADLVFWLWGQEEDTDKSTARKALGFWRDRFEKKPVDQALLDLWAAPEDAADGVEEAASVLWAWSKTPLERKIRDALAQHAPRPERGEPVRDPRGKLVLPWRLSELLPATRVKLVALGLGRLGDEEEPVKERLRLPGTVALAMGWSGGLGAGALLSLTGEAWAAALGGVVLPLIVYGAARQLVRRAVVEEVDVPVGPAEQVKEEKPAAPTKPEEPVIEPVASPAATDEGNGRDHRGQGCCR